MHIPPPQHARQFCGADKVAVNRDDDVAHTKVRLRCGATIAHPCHAVEFGEAQPQAVSIQTSCNEVHIQRASVRE